MALQVLFCWTLAGFSSFLILYTLDRTPSTGDQPVTRPLPTYRTTQTQNKRIQTSMPWVGFEPTIPVFERTKTVHESDRSATAIGCTSVIHELITGLNWLEGLADSTHKRMARWNYIHNWFASERRPYGRRPSMHQDKEASRKSIVDYYYYYYGKTMRGIPRQSTW
jgi:hypothetical protein